MAKVEDLSAELGIEEKENDADFPILFSELKYLISADYYYPILARDLTDTVDGDNSKDVIIESEQEYVKEEVQLDIINNYMPDDVEDKSVAETSDNSAEKSDDEVQGDNSSNVSYATNGDGFCFDGYDSFYDALKASDTHRFPWEYSKKDEQGNSVPDMDLIKKREEEIGLTAEEKIIYTDAFVKIAILDKYSIKKEKKEKIIPKGSVPFGTLVITNKRILNLLPYSMEKYGFNIDKSQVLEIEGTYGKNSILSLKNSQIRIKLYDGRMIIIDKFFVTKNDFEMFEKNIRVALLGKE